jgi:hypothetical protein
MFATQLLEAGAVFGSITAVWFALIGWKLLSPPDSKTHTHESLTESRSVLP